MNAKAFIAAKAGHEKEADFPYHWHWLELSQMVNASASLTEGQAASLVALVHDMRLVDVEQADCSKALMSIATWVNTCHE